MLHREDSSYLCFKEKIAHGDFINLLELNLYEMSSPIDKANDLTIHFKEGSNEKAFIAYEKYDDYLCF